MTTKITIKELAKKTGHSIANISKALNGANGVAVKTRDEIIRLASEYGYKADKRFSGQRSPKKTKTYTFGLLTSFSSDMFRHHYQRYLCAGIMDGVLDSDYELRMIPLKDEDLSDSVRLEHVLNNYQIDGLLALTWRSHQALIDYIQRNPKDIPIMTFNDYDVTMDASCMFCDVKSGMKKGVRFLSDMGYEKIAFLGGPKEHEGKLDGTKKEKVHAIDPQEKFEGFLDGMQEAGIDINPLWVKSCEAYTKLAGFHTAHDLFSQAERPEAVLCGNDDIALGVLKYLADKRISCPEEVTVVGFDGTDEGGASFPGLTSMKQPLEKMGYEGVRKLIELVEKRISGKHVKEFEVTMIMRQSHISK